MRLAGKVAVITGGASGIGRATALLFAREGAKVIVGDLDSPGGEQVARQIRDSGGESHFVPTDVAKAPEVERLVETAVSAFGRLDCMFNNAGITMVGTILEISEADWDRTIAVNLKGVFLGCKYALPHLIHAGGGTIINTSSNAGLIGRPDDPAYCASKHGVIGLTKSLALRHGMQHVRVNAICPGPVETRILQEDRAAAGDQATFNLRSAGQTALKRIGTAEEVAELVAFLASDAARNITGAAIPIDGDKTAGVVPGLVPREMGR